MPEDWYLFFMFNAYFGISFFQFATIGSVDSYVLVEVADAVYASHYHLRVKVAKKINVRTWAFSVPGKFSSFLVTDFLCQV